MSASLALPLSGIWNSFGGSSNAGLLHVSGLGIGRIWFTFIGRNTLHVVCARLFRARNLDRRLIGFLSDSGFPIFVSLSVEASSVGHVGLSVGIEGLGV